MKQPSLACALALLLAGCGTTAHTGPKPVLVPATKYRHYAHWECPDGYHAEDETDWGSHIVWCELDSELEKRIEGYERDMQPEGKP